MSGNGKIVKGNNKNKSRKQQKDLILGDEEKTYLEL